MGNGAPVGSSPAPLKSPQLAKPMVQDVPVLCWERVSPFDIYWTPGVANIEDANVIQRSRLTRAEINNSWTSPGSLRGSPRRTGRIRSRRLGR